MTQRIRGSVVGNLWRVQPKTEQDAATLERRRLQQQEQQRVIETHGSAEEAAAAKPQTVQRQTPKVGRNDPCPVREREGSTRSATAWTRLDPL